MIYPNKFRNMELLDRFLQSACYAAVAVSLFFLLWCVYHSFEHERFSKTPTELLASVELIKLNIDTQQTPVTMDNRNDPLARWNSLPLSDEP